MKSWQKSTIQNAKFKVIPISIKQSLQWRFKNGAIVHESGRFFKVIGASAVINNKVVTQPLIEQREVGTLGFLVYQDKDHTRILVQAKVEPGNVDVCQLAPTFQATASNADQAHGGSAPAYKEIFENPNSKIMYSTLNSEQGSRFSEKLNRNTIVSSDRQIKPTEFHRWMKIEDLLDALNENHLVNTDARSVLVCAPWEQIVKREPFSRYDDKFSQDLRKSYSVVRLEVLKNVLSQLSKARESSKRPVHVKLTNLPGWEVTPYGITPKTNQKFAVEYIKVEAHGREVASWDQPIINSKTDGQVVLLCGRKKGQLFFLIRPQKEIGLLNRVELGPSVFNEPGSTSKFAEFEKGIIRSSVFQSDEGGRFFRDVTMYQVIDIGQIKAAENNGYWLSLGEIAYLLQEGGYFTNEARSVLSLLLTRL